MKLEDLLQNDAATLEAMSDIELHKFFEPMLNITRPDRDTAIYRESSNEPSKPRMTKKEKFLSNMDSQQQMKFKKLLEDGDIDWEDLI